MNQNQGAIVTYQNQYPPQPQQPQQSQINNRNTIVKIKTSAPLNRNTTIKELMTGK